MESGEPEDALAVIGCERQIGDGTSDSSPIGSSSQNHDVAGATRRHHFRRVRADNDLKLWAVDGNPTKIAHEPVLKLGV